MSGRAAALVFATGALGLACGTSQLAHQASRDLACPAKQIDVTELDELRQRADGCGRTATYLCATDMHSRVTCVRQRPSVRKAAQDEAAKEYRCPPELVTLADGPDATTFDAKGCGRTATFSCRALGDNFRCERVGGATVIDDAPPPASASGPAPAAPR